MNPCSGPDFLHLKMFCMHYVILSSKGLKDKKLTVNTLVGCFLMWSSMPLFWPSLLQMARRPKPDLMTPSLPQSAGAVCAVTFRLPSVSALCSRTSRVVNLALSAGHRTVMVDMPSGRDPRQEKDVMRHVQAGDNVFYELPVGGSGGGGGFRVSGWGEK